ncbi:MAG: class I SAM-dependent methyltransferase [Longimicrobiales bacterium]
MAIPRFAWGSNYADAFGKQWNRHPRTQLDSHSGTTITRDRLRHVLGKAIWEALAGAQILECGCGAGRFTEVLLERGSFVTSVDLSEAVNANLLNFPDAARHRVAQADIGSLPFAEQQFDIVLCLGVIQHTPDPEVTILALYDHVRPGGHLVIDHYARTHWTAYVSIKPVVRLVMKRRSPQSNAQLVRRLVDLLLPLHRSVRGIPLIRSFVGRLSPVLHYYGVYPQLSDQMQYDWALLDTNDAMTDCFKHRRTKEELRSVLQSLGAEDIWCEYGGIGVEARCRRPEEPMIRGRG